MPSAIEMLSQQIVRFDPRTLEARGDWLAKHFKIRRPQGDGPFAVVLMLHGCGGIRPFTDDMAEIAAGVGAVAIEIDSYAPRKISRMAALTTICTGTRFRGRERGWPRRRTRPHIGFLPQRPILSFCV